MEIQCLYLHYRGQEWISQKTNHFIANIWQQQNCEKFKILTEGQQNRLL